jgi:hypothetical protein
MTLTLAAQGLVLAGFVMTLFSSLRARCAGHAAMVCALAVGLLARRAGESGIGPTWWCYLWAVPNAYYAVLLFRRGRAQELEESAGASTAWRREGPGTGSGSR